MSRWVYLIVSFFLTISTVHAAPFTKYKMGGKEVTCPGTEMRMGQLDGGNLGMTPRNGLMVLDYSLMREKPVVQTFVFYHECGHQFVGGSEYEADCFAVKNGIYFHWLNLSDLPKVCMSVAGPETDSHPSGENRCAQIYQCWYKWWNK